MALEGKLSDDPVRNAIGTYIKQREDILRYYETLIVASAALGNANLLRTLLDEYYKMLFPSATSAAKKEAQIAKKIMEKLKDVVFVLNDSESGGKR